MSGSKNRMMTKEQDGDYWINEVCHTTCPIPHIIIICVESQKTLINIVFAGNLNATDSMSIRNDSIEASSDILVRIIYLIV